MSKLIMELRIDAAQAYVIHKGRMPRDVHELKEWLREFAKYESDRAERMEQVMREHMNVCNRPLSVLPMSEPRP